MNFDAFEQFEPMIAKYMPGEGEGDTLASQMVTAANHLVYKLYNDGDVPDNTHGLSGWCNDISSFANWLYRYVPGLSDFFRRYSALDDEDEYADLLVDVFKTIQDCVENYENTPAKGSIYDCDGPFVWVEPSNDDDDDDDDDNYDPDRESSKSNGARVRESNRIQQSCQKSAGGEQAMIRYKMAKLEESTAKISKSDFYELMLLESEDEVRDHIKNEIFKTKLSIDKLMEIKAKCKVLCANEPESIGDDFDIYPVAPGNCIAFIAVDGLVGVVEGPRALLNLVK